MARPDENAPKPKRRLAAGLALLALGLIAASLYAFYPLGNLTGDFLASLRPGASGESGQCRAAAAIASRLKPLAKGEIAALQVADRPRPATPLAFQNAKGEPVTLETFRGRAIVLNLWATWCAPCRKEMPALEELQARLGGADFEVVAVNIDTRNFEKPKQFLAEIKVEKLGYFADPSAKIFQDLKVAGRAFGMPTTLVIDKDGCELAWLAGPAEWASPDALAFVSEAIRR
jgi:thiol-disulfide isomerase/thioredoxin